MCRRPARVGQNLKTWLAQKWRRGSPHHNYAQPLLLDASICLFGSWTLALKGSTSQFGLGRHLARALNVSETGRRFGQNLKTWPAQKPRPGSPHHKYAQPLLLNAYVWFVWVMDPGFEGYSTSQF